MYRVIHAAELNNKWFLPAEQLLFSIATIISFRRFPEQFEVRFGVDVSDVCNVCEWRRRRRRYWCGLGVDCWLHCRIISSLSLISSLWRRENRQQTNRRSRQSVFCVLYLYTGIPIHGGYSPMDRCGIYSMYIQIVYVWQFSPYHIFNMDSSTRKYSNII